MQKKSFLFLTWAVIIALAGTIIYAVQERDKPEDKDVFDLGVDSYIYGYPLVLMDITKQVSTNVPKIEGQRGPINQFVNTWKFIDASFKDVVNPNIDTLYSAAWLDLTKEPIVLHIPETGDRYYLMPMLDAWTNVFASPGKRTIGGKGGDFAIVGPNWQGILPAELKEIKSPTNTVWIIGRTLCNGTPEDYAIVNAIQKQYSLTPLSYFGKTYAPPTDVSVNPDIDIKTPPAEQVAKMNSVVFFNTLAHLMKSNPPKSTDYAMKEELALIGIYPGEDFISSKLEKYEIQTIKESVEDSRVEMDDALKTSGNLINGWSFNVSKEMGNYGTNYELRAFVSMVGLGANIPQDAVYPSTRIDSKGKELNGANRYVIHFDKGQTPPVNAFWSVTMYNKDHHFYDNPLNRYSLNSVQKLDYNDDGSLDIFLQHDEPKGNTSNWLPAPEGNFNLIMRLYWPKEEILNGSWNPPPVTKLD